MAESKMEESVFEWIWQYHQQGVWSPRMNEDGWIINLQNSGWLPSSSWENEWVKFIFVQIVREDNKVSEWQDGRCLNQRLAEFKNGCHHQVEWEWMSLSQIELVWVRVRVERVFLSVSENNGWIQDGRIQDGCHHLLESEWISEVLFCANSGI